MEVYRKMANVVAAVHLFWVFAVTAGLLLALIFPGYLRIQLALVTTTVASQLLMRFRCPLTKLEVFLRRKVDPDYQPFDSCVQHYLEKWFGIKTPRLLGGFKLFLTAAASWTLWLAK